MWPFQKNKDEACLAEIRDALQSLVTTNAGFMSRLKAYERDRIALVDEITVVRTQQRETDTSNDKEFGRVNSRLKEIETRLDQTATAVKEKVESAVSKLYDQHTEFRREMLTALGVLRMKYKDLQKSHFELTEFKVEAMKEILALEGQIGIIREVSIGDLIDGGKIQECPDLEEYYDSELQFLLDLQQAYQKYPRLNVIIGHWDGRVPSQNTEVEFQNDGNHIEELEYKYCIRKDGRIGHYNDVEIKKEEETSDACGAVGVRALCVPQVKIIKPGAENMGG